MRRAILSIVLFLSGCAALIFEMLWLRSAGLVFGNSVWSAALILSSFMAGLALGNALAARCSRSLRNPLRLYALLEVVIAVCGCALMLALPRLGVWFRPIFGALSNHELTSQAVRLGLSFVLLLVPTTAMGLTLPVVLADRSLASHKFGNAMGWLYGWNTLGAVTGALLGELVFIGAFGLWGTAIAAATFDLLAACLAVVLSRGAAGEGESADESKTSLRIPPTDPAVLRLLLGCAVTGALLLALEVVWFRVLRLFVAVSATAFAFMLAVVLTGIGFGAIAAGLVHRRTRDPGKWLAVLLPAAGLVTPLCYLFFPGDYVQREADAFHLDPAIKMGALSLALIFPSAFMSGMIFPTIAAAVQEQVGGRMRSAGLVTLFNTVGAALGPLLAGFVFLPTIGAERTLVMCAAAYALAGLVVTPIGRWRSSPGWRGLVLVAAVALLVVLFPYGWGERYLTNPRIEFEHDERAHLVRTVEGTADTLQLLRIDAYGQPYYYRLLTDAFSMSATAPTGQCYMRLFAYLPLTLQPHAHDALLICFGLGATADALVRDDQLRKIDVVDISREVFDLAKDRVDSSYANPLTDPRVRAFVQDGRFFLQSTPNKYDVITGEPPPPKVLGAVNLYTREFFQAMRSRLNPNGVASFWLPIYQMRVGEVKAILRGFHDAFENASLWAGPDEEWIMVGINGPGTSLTSKDVARLWNKPATAIDLKRIGIELPEQLGALFLMDRDEIDRLTNGTRPLTDNFPKRLSDRLPDADAINDLAWSYLEREAAVRRFRDSSLIGQIWPASMIGATEPFFWIRDERFLSLGQHPDRFTELDFYLRRTQLRTPVLEVMNSNEFRLKLAEELANSEADLPNEAVIDLFAGALARRDYQGAIDLLQGKRTRRMNTGQDTYYLIYLYCLNGEVDKADALAAAEGAINPNDPEKQKFWHKLQAEFGFHPPL